MAEFKWTPTRNNAAVYLAQGYTNRETAEHTGVSERTIERWRADSEFSAEVDRLSVMVDLASRAERVRLAQRIMRKMGEKTERDLLDWLKFIQSETDGAKLDSGFIAQLASLFADGSLASGLAPAESASATRGGDGAGGATSDSTSAGGDTASRGVDSE